MAAGRAAQEAGDAERALYWLDRARRITPQDQPLALEVAILGLQTNDPLAAPIFERLARRFDVAEAWLGLIAARVLANNHEGAAEALAELLGRHAWRPDWELVVSRAVPSDGWCALAGDGRLHAGRADIVWQLDGVTLRAGAARLPAGWQRARRLTATVDGSEAIGSPIRIDRMVRLEGRIAAGPDGLSGWVWHPADPERVPVLRLPGRPDQVIRARRRLDVRPAGHPFAQPRIVDIPAEMLRAADRPARLLGPDGKQPGAPRATPASRPTPAPDGPAVILVSHDAGGGTALAVRARAAALIAEGRRPVILTPADKGRTRLDGVPHSMAELVKALRALRPLWLEQHHLRGHVAGIAGLAARLRIPARVWLHDYAVICPRTSIAGPDGRYCGEPPPSDCAACLAACGDPVVDVAALRRGSARMLAAAEQVLTPSADAAARLQRHFPAITPLIVAGDEVRAPWGRQARADRLVVAVVGAITARKGLDVLLDCARDAAARGLDLEFALVGFSEDDAALIETGHVRITGLFDEDECQGLIARQRAALGFVPSVWPETWCFALSHLWQAGLPTVAFDLGAQGERVRAAGGLVLPVALPAGRINDALLAYARATGEPARR